MPEPAAYTSFLRACRYGNLWKQSVETVDIVMIEAGVEPGASHYRVVLQTLRDSNQWQKSESLIENMKVRWS